MRLRTRALSSLSLVWVCAVAQSLPAEPKEVLLAVGSPSPALKVGSWAQGKPLASLKKGQIYVIEFWATWCGPCVRAMPHLSELSKKFSGKVTFVGVNVWEDRDGGYTAPQKVSNFLKENPGKMTYNVAVDTKDSYMAKNWLTRAGVNSIPTSIVIGPDQKVAFIGHPADLDLVLEPLIEGRFDAKAFAMRPQTPDLGPISKAVTDRNVKGILSEAARIESRWPIYKDLMSGYRFLASYIDKPTAADKEFDKRLEQIQASSLSMALITLSECEWLKEKELYRVSQWLERIVLKDEVQGFLALVALPRVYQKLGDGTKAEEARKRLAATSQKMGLENPAAKKPTSAGNSGGGQSTTKTQSPANENWFPRI